MNDQKKVALVTGAAGIIGPSICEALKADGWIVAACDRNEAEFSLTQKYRPIACDQQFYADLTQPGFSTELVKQVESNLGPVQLLINNAGYGGSPHDLAQLEEVDANQVAQVNLMAPLFLTQAVLPSLIRYQGSVIMFSSVLTQVIRPRTLVYSAAKAGVERLTESLAHELGPQRVRVNCIRVGSVPGPAFIRPLLSRMDPDDARRLYEYIIPLHLNRAAEKSRVPLRGSGENIASMIRYLISDEAEYVTGATLPVDGGYAYRQQEETAGIGQTSKLVQAWLIENGLAHLIEGKK